MEGNQQTSRETLLGYVGGDTEKLEYYLKQLSTCKKAFDVADRVIKPIYLNEGIDYKVLTQGAFYAPVADLAPEIRGHKLNPKTLYYHISANQSDWKKERDKREKASQSEEYVDTQIEIHPEGSFDTYIHIHSNHIPKDMEEMFRSYLSMGYLSMRQKLIKHFDARGDLAVSEIGCPSLLAVDVLLMLQERCENIVVTYKSRFTTQENISIDEAIEIAEEETYAD